MSVPILYRVAVLAAFALPAALSISNAPERAATFSGRITTAAGKPIAAAQVMVQPWNAGTVTNDSGRYELKVPAAKIGDRAIIVVQGIGFNTHQVELVIAAEKVTTDITMPEMSVVLAATPVTIDARNEQTKAAAGQAPAVRSIREADFTGVGIAGGRADGVEMQRSEMFSRAIHPSDPRFNTESYAAIDENPFVAVAGQPLSTFSIDVDRASYANVRRFIGEGRMPPKDAVRIEELINYFSYDDPAPRGSQPFTVTTELAPAPWKSQHQLLRIGLKARSLENIDAPPSNFVFLIDVSGSMTPANKLPLLKRAFGLLVNELRPQDRVAMVVYAGQAGLVLESTTGDRKEEILHALERLEAGGSTAGGAGLRLAYEVAKQNYIRGGNNRIILATDGDFNIGASSDAEMMRLVEEHRAQGTFLTVLGFGRGNLKDSKMETLADKGNGNFAYIDDIMEARKVLVHELGGTLFTVAKDVKLQVEFNPALVQGYRLIGYENRLLAAADFNNDAKDAGELGAGHSVTALYEIIPAGVKTDIDLRTADSLRYQAPPTTSRTSATGEIAFVKLRYKLPDGEKSALLEHPVVSRATRPGNDFRFAAAVASYGMLLRESPHRGNATFESVLDLARAGRGVDRGGYRLGFIEMVERTRTIARVVADNGSIER